MTTTSLDGRLLRDAFSCFPSGVTAVCALIDDRPVGMAASSFTTLSLDPPQVLVCVSRTSATWEALQAVDHIGVSVLGDSHGAVCRQLAGPAAGRFDGVEWSATENGAVRIGRSPLFLECAVEQAIGSGDHFILVLTIHEIAADPDVAPLVFHRSAFHGLAQLAIG